MWNEALELDSARRFQKDNSISLEPGLKPRPKIFDVRCGNHSTALILFLQRLSKLSNAGDDVGSRCQRETGDVGVALRRRRTELSHRT
jgi:hypothetical protein